ncbi:Hsp20/alpha crystallin family protein [Halobacillus massiliensis]|uniref:Hsp20/alpha crystallin family protein n=1 Tax=Halobacillus massiliensis TaxID=1926286 RepID=UPI0009E4F868|nr:Hsp20/alpha crystallin family protein [Halobacillus massiliensis]
MPLLPNDSFRQLTNMRREFDRVFNELPWGFDEERSLGGIRVDVHETESEVIAECDLPGLESKENVDIEIENNVLRISGTIHKTKEKKEENMHRQERYTGSFHRAITLPCPVSQEGASAVYKNGVLEVKMPKRTEEEKNKIEVDFH